MDNYKTLMEKFNNVCDENAFYKSEIERYNVQKIEVDKAASKLSSEYQYSASENGFFNFKLSNVNIESGSNVKNSTKKNRFYEEKNIVSNNTDMSNYSSINKMSKPMLTEEANNHLEDSNLKINPS